MKKILAFATGLFLFVTGSAGAQEAAESGELATYREQFQNASLPVKVQIVTDALELGRTDFGPLYKDALTYVVNQRDKLKGDPALRELAALAVRGVDETAYAPAALDLWTLFEADEETTLRVSIFKALQKIVRPGDPVMEGVHRWLQEQNAGALVSGVQRDRQVLEACMDALAVIGDPASFDPLVHTILVQYSQTITQKAFQALLSLGDVDVVDGLGRMMEREQQEVREKIYEVFTTAPALTEEQHRRVAEKALEVAIEVIKALPAPLKQVSMWRYRIASFLVENPPEGSFTPVAIDHFNLTLLEYDRGIAPRSAVAEAVALLGAMDTDEAAERLTAYLDLINTYTERSLHYDIQITLAVIENLKNLGRKVAYNSLLYTTFLNYPARIKNAAREAMQALND
ncbi:hypothetical protein Spith_1308 [Spirochaeta thermophila DSM 6578]|uniref:HEAT repeat domain-containing protein n=1 Tax=Winmispira thermophila (strain ATCC 700085 / DSM 6578 / Z-1203) TaxID=869211 RepID=G0GFF9_WINT7|nr:hypothetical protein [Spirochaeta thermophila]AEJ61573.1 hypothetical protein Spith_1308 [Spirochaeta thermophila DSM 6578]